VRIRLDHVVIKVSHWGRSNAFYRSVLGAELIADDPAGPARYRFGDQQLNVHGPGVDADPVATRPVEAGNSDLCFEWDGPIDDVIRHLEDLDVKIEQGPVARFGGRGNGTSVYFRDPDGSLLELISYS
jgi:catechol 2,3-dioxygenase-like lactoylglutathione lyase family enzyme